MDKAAYKVLIDGKEVPGVDLLSFRPKRSAPSHALATMPATQFNIELQVHKEEYDKLLEAMGLLSEKIKKGKPEDVDRLRVELEKLERKEDE